MMQQKRTMRKTGSSDIYASLRPVAQRITAYSETERAAALDGMTNLMGAIRQEIEETVLSRRVALLSGTQPVAYLELSNRKLVGFSVCKTADTPERKLRLEAEGVLQEIEALQDRSGPLSLAHAERLQAQPLSEGSLTSADLDVAPMASGAGPQIDVFLARTESFLSGFVLCIDGRETRRQTPDQDRDAFDRLVAAGQAQLSDGDEVSHLASARPACTIMPLSSNRRALIASGKSQMLAAVFDVSQQPSILSAWRSCFSKV